MKTGIVISAGVMAKTVRVRVAKQVWHSHLRKNFTRHENFMAHDERNACVAGDVVRIVPGHRSSRHKRHMVSEIVSPFRTGEQRRPVESVQEWEARQKAKYEAKVQRRAEANQPAAVLDSANEGGSMTATASLA